MSGQKPDSGKNSEEKSRKIIGRRYRYTGDYQIVSALGPNGSREKRMFYTGRWIRPVNEAEEYETIIRWLRILTVAAVLAVLGALGLHPAAMTHRWYLPVLTIGLFPLFYQGMGAVRLPAKRSYMERQRYEKSIVRVGHSAVAVLVLCCISALGCVIYWILASTTELEGSEPYSLRDGVFAVLLILAMLSERMSYRFFRKIQTDTYDNDAYHP